MTGTRGQPEPADSPCQNPPEWQHTETKMSQTIAGPPWAQIKISSSDEVLIRGSNYTTYNITEDTI